MFRLLRELTTLNPRLVAECMAEVTAVAKEVEEKRGAGSDQAMRYVSKLRCPIPSLSRNAFFSQLVFLYYKNYTYHICSNLTQSHYFFPQWELLC